MTGLTSISRSLLPLWLNMNILPLKLRFAVIVSRFIKRARVRAEYRLVLHYERLLRRTHQKWYLGEDPASP